MEPELIEVGLNDCLIRLVLKAVLLLLRWEYSIGLSRDVRRQFVKYGDV